MDSAVYAGLDWKPDSAGRPRLWARSAITPVIYVVDHARADGCDLTLAYARTPDEIGLNTPTAPAGRHGSAEEAVLAAESNDYKWFRSVAERNGRTAAFSGSPRARAAIVRRRNTAADGEPAPGDEPTPFDAGASFFQFEKGGLKQNADGKIAMTVTMDPNLIPLWLFSAAPGEVVLVGAVPLGHKEQTERRAWNKRAEDARVRTHTRPEEPDFQQWMMRRYDRWGLSAAATAANSDAVEQAVAETLKRLLGIPSRADLAANRDAVERFEKLDREYYADMARGAQQQEGRDAHA